MRMFVGSRNRIASLASIVALGAFAVAYVWLSYGFAPKVRAFPLMIGWTMIGLVVLDLIGHTRTAAGRFVAAMVGMDKPPAQTGGAADNPAGIALVWITFYGVMVYLVGFLPASGLYMFVSMAVFGSTPAPRAALSAAALVAVLWLFFEVALGSSLYRGILLGPLLASV